MTGETWHCLLHYALSQCDSTSSSSTTVEAVGNQRLWHAIPHMWFPCVKLDERNPTKLQDLHLHGSMCHVRTSKMHSSSSSSTHVYPARQPGLHRCPTFAPAQLDGQGRAFATTLLGSPSHFTAAASTHAHYSIAPPAEV
jgi:hypothetical protein